MDSGARFLKPVAGPVLYAAMTGVAGYIGHFPLMWIMVAAAVVFMAGVVSIYFMGAHSFARSPVNKLRYTATITNCDLAIANRKTRKSAAPDNPIRSIDKIQIGVQVQNTAHFPISVFVEKAETEIESSTPPRTTYPKNPVLLLPGNVVFMVDSPIKMDNRPCGNMEGKMDITIKYGRKGKEKFSMRFDAKLQIFMTKEGLIQRTYTHWNSDQI